MIATNHQSSVSKSALESLGTPPSHWSLFKVGWHMRMSIGWTPPSSNHSFYGGRHNWATIADLTAGRIRRTKSTITDAAIEQRGATQAPAGSLLFSYKLSIGQTALLDAPSFTNEAIAAFHPNEFVDLNFWKYLAPVVLPKYARTNIYGSPLLNQDLINSCRFYAPSRDDQRTISRYLDDQTGRIDSLISKKTHFIELLREKRQALITHAVTKGLDPNVPMKDSGVEWLGSVPAHWDVVRGSAVFVECTAKNDPLVSEDYLSLMANVGIIPYEEKGDVGNKKPEDVRKCKLVEPGDFVLNSMNYAIGSYGVSRYSGVCSPVYVVMKHRMDAADPKFLDLILSNPSYQNYAQSFGTGILDHRRAIGWDEIKVIRVPLPPLNEQAQIAAWAISRRDRVDTLIAKTERSIELLREHRTALITTAVTGKLDLRATT